MNRVAFRAVLFTVGAGLSRHFPRLFFMTATAYRPGLPGSGEVNRHGVMWVMAGSTRFKTVMFIIPGIVTVTTSGHCVFTGWMLCMAIKACQVFPVSRAFFLDGPDDLIVAS